MDRERCAARAIVRSQHSVSRTHARRTKDAILRGAEAHWFAPFAIIKNRLQIGLNLAGGTAVVSGDIEETVVSVSNVLPLFKLEAQAALIVTAAFKIKVAGGVSFPGTGVSVAAVYLIGAK